MANWTGFVGLGTLSGSTFTELSNAGYARLAFSFNAPINGIVTGAGSAITFATVTGTAWTYLLISR